MHRFDLTHFPFMSVHFSFPLGFRDYKSLSMIPCLEKARARTYSSEGFTGLFIVTENANAVAVNRGEERPAQQNVRAWSAAGGAASPVSGADTPLG